ncbi:hypothetical protein [Methanosarcina sp. UBA411]|uniref:hypothetical protein n=1 Tax=Methanosarcina sp. UBA411 TaxID=1915589 RepID=UPI0025D008EC|nr:hypothetical protein [Methanosarcina sp. UBA411]
MSIDKNKEENKIDPRSTRLVCAKLYEGGLLCSYKILSSIKRKPFKGKSPEFELDIDRITKEAEAAFKYHMKFALMAVVLSFLGLIFSIYMYDYSSFELWQYLYYGYSEQFGFVQFMFYAFSISAICLLLLKPVHDRSIALGNFSKGHFNPKFDKNISSETQNGIESILTKLCDWITRSNVIIEEDKGNSQNIILFGDYFPFLGAGIKTRNWNFVTDLTKQKKGLGSLVEFQNNQEKGSKISELSLKELYEAVCDRIDAKNLPNLSYKFILFADGNKEDEVGFLLRDRLKPCTYNKQLQLLTDQLLNKSVENDQSENIKSFFDICEEGIFKDYRTYFNISHLDKNRSTLFSTFLRLSKIEKELFAECSFYVLTPIDENIYNIDKLPKNNSFFTVKSMLVTVGLIIVYILFSELPYIGIILAFVLFIFAVRPLAKILINRAKETEYSDDIEQIKRGEPHNYGLSKTFRETIASPDYKNYFGAQDIILIQNTIENAIIDSVADLLDAKGIDTSFIRSEMVSFINKGIMQFGGKMENSQVAFGDGIKVAQKMQQFTQKVFSASKEFKNE